MPRSPRSTGADGDREVALEFAPDGVRRIAEIAFQVNERTENIGARRLHTVMERLLETVSYDADEPATRTAIRPRPARSTRSTSTSTWALWSRTRI